MANGRNKKKKNSSNNNRSPLRKLFEGAAEKGLLGDKARTAVSVRKRRKKGRNSAK